MNVGVGAMLVVGSVFLLHFCRVSIGDDLRFFGWSSCVSFGWRQQGSGEAGGVVRTLDGWEARGLEHEPVIPEQMPVLVDSDLCFEGGPALPRPLVAVKRWLGGLPWNGCPEPGLWGVYARAVRDRAVFLRDRGIELFDQRDALKSGLSAYAVHRGCGVVERAAGIPFKPGQAA